MNRDIFMMVLPLVKLMKNRKKSYFSDFEYNFRLLGNVFHKSKLTTFYCYFNPCYNFPIVQCLVLPEVEEVMSQL